MTQRGRMCVALLLVSVLSVAVVGFSDASAPPVGPLPSGPSATISTEKGQLIAVALPEYIGGRVWRIARAYNGNVIDHVWEQGDVAGNIVIVFRANRGRKHDAQLCAYSRRTCQGL